MAVTSLLLLVTLFQVLQWHLCGGALSLGTRAPADTPSGSCLNALLVNSALKRMVCAVQVRSAFVILLLTAQPRFIFIASFK